MHIELGPAAARLLQAQARAAGMNVAHWIEHLAVEHEDAQNGAQILTQPTVYRASEVLSAVTKALEGMDDEGTVYVEGVKSRIAQVEPDVCVTQVSRLLAELGVERATDQQGGHYNVGAIRQAIIDHTE